MFLRRAETNAGSLGVHFLGTSIGATVGLPARLHAIFSFKNSLKDQWALCDDTSGSNAELEIRGVRKPLH